MTFHEKKLTSEIVYSGKLVNVRRDTVTARSGESVREIVEHADGVVICAVTPEGKIFMERQFRYAFGRDIYELPAGKVDPGEEPLTAARRELREETGLTAGSMRLLSEMIPSCGFSTEKLYIYMATGLTQGKQDLDLNESLEVEEHDLDEVFNQVVNGEIEDGKTALGVLLTMEAVRRGELEGYLK